VMSIVVIRLILTLGREESRTGRGQPDSGGKSQEGISEDASNSMIVVRSRYDKYIHSGVPPYQPDFGS
jgi:hypothetical protein